MCFDEADLHDDRIMYAILLEIHVTKLTYFIF